MARLVLLAFVALPIVEIALFIAIGQAIGLLPTVLGLVATMLVGMLLMRVQGRNVLTDLRRAAQGGVMPARAVSDAMMVGLAGLLFLLPGFFTDLLAILLLLPPVRVLIHGWLATRMVVVRPGPTSPYGEQPGPGRLLDLDEDDWRRQ